MAGTFAEFQKEGEKKAEGQEQTPPAAGQSASTEPVVIIDGQSRPLKNYESEIERKHQAEMQRIKDDYESRIASIGNAATSAPQQRVDTNDAWIQQYAAAAENEIATTGRTVPIQTLAYLAGQIASRGIQETLQTREKAESTKRSFLKEARKNEDWKEIEEDFHEIADQLSPNQVNQQTLEVILLSARGKKANEVIKKAKDKAKEDAERSPEIIGSPTEGGRAAPAGNVFLTAVQRDELYRLDPEGNIGLDDRWYIEKLKEKQQRAKDEGKKIPHLLNERST